MPAAAALDGAAEHYVRLALALGRHDPGYVDAYYGPPAWREEAEAANLTLAAIRRAADSLARALDPAPSLGADRMLVVRHRYLADHIRALGARASLLSGVRRSFDEESAALYGVVAPRYSEAHFQPVLDDIDRALPGPGPLADRFQAFRQAFLVPPARYDTVLKVSLAACRARTARHLALPPGEGVTVEYIAQPGTANNLYEGQYRSRVQIFTGATPSPLPVEGVLHTACHEAYPGHHVLSTLREQRLVRDRGWVEHTLLPLHTPLALFAEGSANYGARLAFPEAERVAFARDTLFPLAGLDPARAAEYFRVLALAERLEPARVEAVRRYLDGVLDAEAAARWLTTYGMISPAGARQRIRRADQLRTYIINYTTGEALVAAQVDSAAGPNASTARRWAAFAELLTWPRPLSRGGER